MRGEVGRTGHAALLDRGGDVVPLERHAAERDLDPAAVADVDPRVCREGVVAVVVSGWTWSYERPTLPGFTKIAAP